MIELSNVNQLLHWTPNEALTSLPVVDEADHRAAMRHFSAPVSIITTLNRGRSAGVTATAICSVTADPPRLVAFVNKKTYAAEQILESGLLCVNTLAGSQVKLARIFAGMNKEIPGPERFNYGNWTRLITGAPILTGAKANFDCRVIKVFDESTHYAFLSEVLITQSDTSDEALIYMGGKFYTVKASE